MVRSDRAASYCGAGFFQNLAYLLTAGNLARAGVAGVIGEDKTLRVKKGAWAPLRFSNMLSLPATGMTLMLVTRGEEWLLCGKNS